MVTLLYKGASWMEERFVHLVQIELGVVGLTQLLNSRCEVKNLGSEFTSTFVGYST